MSLWTVRVKHKPRHSAHLPTQRSVHLPDSTFCPPSRLDSLLASQLGILSISQLGTRQLVAFRLGTRQPACIPTRHLATCLYPDWAVWLLYDLAACLYPDLIVCLPSKMDSTICSLEQRDLYKKEVVSTDKSEFNLNLNSFLLLWQALLVTILSH